MNLLAHTWRRIVLLIGLMLWPLAGSAQPVPPPLRIGIIGDQTGTDDLTRSYAVLQEGVSALASRGVDVVLHTGDLVESRLTEDEIRALYASGTAILDQLPVKWYLTPGDHDVVPPAFRFDSTDRSRERLFQDLYSIHAPEAAQHLFYGLDVNGYHVVALYAHEALHVDPRWGDIFLAKLSQAQLDWLTADLEAHRTAKGVVIVIHQPLWYHWSAWREVHEVLRRYPVAAVIAGHFHYAQDDGNIDGIQYLTVGATGGDLKPGSREAGNVHMVSILTVLGRQTSLELIPLRDSRPLTLPPRLDMDRVQAIQLVLEELWNFSDQPLFWTGGGVVESCETGKPARLRVVPIGNPIDLPVTVTIEPIAGHADRLEGGTFVANECASPGNASGCVLPPAARMWWSNYSTIQVAQGVPSLWEARFPATLAANPGRVELNVRMAFTAAGSTFFRERRVSADVKACP